MKKVVIVESPSKTKTISKYLGSDYEVLSSKGHIRDLATTGKFGLGIDVENDFKPNYIQLKDKKSLINTLKKECKGKEVYLASDPDREGEAIAWHLKSELGLDNYKRIVFNEITKPALLKAIESPRDIDINLVKSQETRRMLDRIIGFRLSKLMQSKTSGKSAGRVQSVALKLIVEREREIEAFEEEEYWTITAKFPDFDADLEKYKNKKIKIESKEKADEILDALSKTFQILEIESKVKSKKSVMPFTTSTLQQSASTILNYNSSKTMRIAQKLYEGVDIGSETVGLISYMRTDSTRLSPVFIDSTMNYITKNYGKEYVGTVKKAKTGPNTQDAHEAIRPTDITRDPEKIKEFLTNEEFKLYNLIYKRALASLMKDAKVNATTINLENNGYLFKATGQVIVFDGYLKVYSEFTKSEDKPLPALEEYKSKVVIAESIEKNQHFTKPPSRYTEASLIKEMESLGIGRPSTYAKTMDTLKNRSYVNMVDKKFIPTEVGFEITDKLSEGFDKIINVKYTAEMESSLDKIAENKCNYVETLRNFYDEFEPLVEKAFKTMEKPEPEKTGEKCPECGHDLVVRNGRFGKFVACSNYPACKYIKTEKKEALADCPKCDGHIIEKRTKRGKIFYGCDRFPKCTYAMWDKPTGEKCPKCGELLAEKKGNIYCQNCDKKDADTKKK